MDNIFKLDSEYVASTYGRFPVHIIGGKGSLLYGNDGKQYIDMGSGIAVNTFGIADDEWINAVTAQLGKVQHTSNLYYTDPCVLLAKALCEKTGMKKVFFSNSGAEANECAIKTARKYAAEKKGAEYNTVITLKNSFHGRTVTTLAATGQEVFHKDFLPLTDGFAYVEANNLDDLKKKVSSNKVAAIMFEPVQGEGGVLPLTDDFIDGITEIAQKEDILIIADEVQTGNGRCGTLYASLAYKVLPDIISTAKGLGGGLPIGATMLGEKVKDILTPGTHGSTFGGNPVCCAGALSIINRIDDDLLSEVMRKSELIRYSLEGAKGIKSVSGRGLMLGIEVEGDAKAIINRCIKNGVIPLTAKTKVRLLPALNIPDELLIKALEVIKEACAAEAQGV